MASSHQGVTAGLSTHTLVSVAHVLISTTHILKAAVLGISLVEGSHSDTLPFRQ
jgi:phosphate/sulfate permease